MTAGAIILAAGSSSRMAGEHKLLQLWRDKPLIAHAVDAVLAAGLPPPIVVLGSRADDIRAAIGDRLIHPVVAVDYHAGMSRSLRAGVAAVPGQWTAALICLADMPRIEPALIAALAARAAPETIAVPMRCGRRGNPVLWGRNYFPALMAGAGDRGGQALLQTLSGHILEVAAPSDAIFSDIDTVNELKLLKEDMSLT